VDDSDIVVAVFDSRLGKVTEDAVSGTAHEIERTAEAGKPVHVYFSNEPVSRSAAADSEEMARLNKFREDLAARSLLGFYADPTDLGYQVREAVEHDLTQMDLGVAELPVAAPPEHAVPRLSYDGDNIVVNNLSTTVRADQLTLEIPDGAYRIDYDDEPVNLLPLGSAQWPAMVFAQSPRKIMVNVKWTENGEPHEEPQTVYFY
jgi:hypothetical protein